RIGTDAKAEAEYCERREARRALDLSSGVPQVVAEIFEKTYAPGIHVRLLDLSRRIHRNVAETSRSTMRMRSCRRPPGPSSSMTYAPEASGPSETRPGGSRRRSDSASRKRSIDAPA